MLFRSDVGQLLAQSLFTGRHGFVEREEVKPFVMHLWKRATPAGLKKGVAQGLELLLVLLLRGLASFLGGPRRLLRVLRPDRLRQPVRLGELGTVYRYERSGTMHGLLRVRGFTQDDAHIFCLPEQIADEIADQMLPSADGPRPALMWMCSSASPGPGRLPPSAIRPRLWGADDVRKEIGRASCRERV